MKRLAIVLAAAVLGTGCVVSPAPCDPGAITLSWPAFELYNGTFVASCGAAGVYTVDVFMDGALVGSGSLCTDGGVVITAVPSGTHTFTVEGLDTGGAILYRDQFTVPTDGCGNVAVTTQPAEGSANLNYSLVSPAACTTASCYLWFSVQDTLANVVAASASASGSATTFQYPNNVIIRLAAGSYKVNWMQLVNSGFTQDAAACLTPTFTVAPGLTTDVPEPLKLTCP